MAHIQVWTTALVAMLAVPSLSQQFSVMNFTFSKTKQKARQSQMVCKDLGYDGLGVLSTPEAYAHVLRITSFWPEKAGFYVGIQRPSGSTRLMWDDGSVLPTDLPWADNQPADEPWGAADTAGHLLMVTGSYKKYALCGNYGTPTMTEAYGTTLHGHKPVDTRFRLSESKTSSYFECVVMCSQDNLCRLVDFRADIFTCTLLGPGTLNVTTENSASTTFIRVKFKALT
ncbi:hypothetical protein PoB_001680700 [Plakobranchus ocellatus]|uniref:C-type lectin domain-containing protein n=1 Tax=Plakobranchus ocellatus TaxID=259542 RepID=A0AAV3Z4X9_9GAST|nr:hypothetical protein PoB_001680700 [Plakobranchus ocellatus]